MENERQEGPGREKHRGVPVAIGGRTYRLQGDDPEELRRLAEEVDRTIREIAGDRASLDDPRVVVLSALNVAAEREDLRRAVVRGAGRLRERLAALEARLAALEETVAEGPSLPGED